MTMPSGAVSQTARSVTQLVKKNEAEVPRYGDAEPAIMRETWLAVWTRRAITVPALIFACFLWIALSVVVFPVALALDVVRGRPLLIARFYLMMGVVIVGQFGGLYGHFLNWVY